MSMTRSVIGIACILAFLATATSAGAGEPVVVAGVSLPKDPQQPQVVVDGSGIIHVAFGAKISGMVGEVFYSRSEDGGQSFSRPVSLATLEGLSLGKRRGPRIAVVRGTICVSIIGHKDGNLRLYRSLDKGKTWENPVTVNDHSGSASEGLHGMAASLAGELTCVWLDHRHKQSEVFSSTSIDGGQSWSKNVLAYHSPDGAVCPCCHPSVTYSPDGKIHVLWRNDLAGSRDMYHAVSSDGGKTFAQAAKLGAGSWPIDFCPMDGGSIVVSSRGNAATVWRRDKTVFFCGSDDAKEIELGPGEQPWLTDSAQGLVAVWLRKRGHSLMLQALDTRSSIELAKSASDPTIASGGPNNQILVAAWEDISTGSRRVLCQRIALPPSAPSQGSTP